MTADAASQVQLTGTRPRVHGSGLADDEAIGDELANGHAGVGVGDLADLVGVQPDLVLATAQDGRGKTLLGTQVDPGEKEDNVSHCVPTQDKTLSRDQKIKQEQFDGR